jgi:hypothetical protein
MALAVRSIERRVGSPLGSAPRERRARDPCGAPRPARDRGRGRVASRAGAFALAKALRDDTAPFTGVIVILLERKHDAWLARWSGADAWFVRPVDPFELADRVLELVTEKESA